MRIEIDTQKDRREELLHVAKLLLKICDQESLEGSRIQPAQEYSQDQFFSSSNSEYAQNSQTEQPRVPQENIFSLFDAADQNQQSQTQNQTSTIAQDQQAPSIFSLFENDEKPMQSSTYSPSSSSQNILEQTPSDSSRPKKRDFLAEGYLIPYD